MLSKCANPDCSAALHYFGEGKLFEVHFDNAERCMKAGRIDVAPMKKQPRRVEHFWLCENCSETLTVGLDRRNNVKVLPLAKKTKRAIAS